MFNNSMPVGNPYYFEGDVLKYFSKCNFNYPCEDDLNGNLKIKTKSIFDYLNNIFEIKNELEFN
jgi:hypothetical protein